MTCAYRKPDIPPKPERVLLAQSSHQKEISLGQISRREAIARAIEANHYIEQNYSPVLLPGKLRAATNTR